jgi:hypothetical protein
MSIYDDIHDERKRQDELWGGPDHDDNHESEDWAAFIESLALRLEMEHFSYDRTRELFIHIAALAVAAIESLDRKSGRTTKLERQIK